LAIAQASPEAMRVRLGAIIARAQRSAKASWGSNDLARQGGIDDIDQNHIDQDQHDQNDIEDAGNFGDDDTTLTAIPMMSDASSRTRRLVPGYSPRS
jgi:hypothetical protein